MSYTQTSQPTDYSTDPVNIINKLSHVVFINIDDKTNVKVTGRLKCRIEGTDGVVDERKVSLSTTDLLQGWSIPDPASTEEVPLPAIVVSTGLTAAQKQGLQEGFKGIEKMIALKCGELKDLPHDETDVFA